MDSDRLFLERCKQVEKGMQSSDELELLDLSAKLRQLFLDDHPLIHLANHERRIKLKFVVGDFTQAPDVHTVILSLEDGLDPDGRRPGTPRTEVGLDGFLGHKVLYLKGQPHTVRDVIKLAANVSGGVHRTPNPDQRQKLLADFAASISIGGLPGALRQLQAIARGALKGLRPLIEAVEGKR
jgi:hypothetical protein